MHSDPNPVPAGLPLLSAGRHRRPRDGACMMELVSLLAGERWSDAPACTHPLLARLARLVNDATSDDARHRLVPLVTALVGLRPRRPEDRDRWDTEVALVAAATALPVAATWDQAPLAAAILTCERALGPGLSPEGGQALATAPEASAWAADLVDQLRTRAGDVPGGAIVEFAVGAVVAGVDDPDPVLCALLTRAVDRCAALVGRTVGAPAPDASDQPARPAATTSRTVGATS